MPLSIGIVGLPNVGKSSLFNLLTKTQVEASNYPFCTIDPNVGVVAVPDERLEKIAEISKPEKILPTTIEFVDIAGLVKGAHKGEGLGNQFLANVRECDAICEVIRNFENKNIVHVNGKINPLDDKDTIDLELVFADLQTVEKNLEKTTREAKSGDKEIIKRQTVLEKIKANLEDGIAAREIELTKEEEEIIKPLNLLSKKPIIYLLNGKLNEEIKTQTSFPVIEIDIKLEEEILNLNEEEQKEYLEELGIKKSGLNKLIGTSYKVLNLETFFTTGEDETKAWTVKKGTKAPEAAGVIHTDFIKGFVRAEVINWKNFVEVEGEQTAKEKGLMRIEGKEYIVQDGDICHFLINK